MNRDFPTPLSLLAALQTSTPPEARWREFHDLYAPLILTWARQQGFQEADALDVTQEVLIKVARTLPTYVREPGQSFRSWLYRLALEKGYLDGWLMTWLVNPLLNLLRFCDHLERRWAAVFTSADQSAADAKAKAMATEQTL